MVDNSCAGKVCGVRVVLENREQVFFYTPNQNRQRCVRFGRKPFFKVKAGGNDTKKCRLGCMSIKGLSHRQQSFRIEVVRDAAGLIGFWVKNACIYRAGFFPVGSQCRVDKNGVIYLSKRRRQLRGKLLTSANLHIIGQG